MASSGLRIVRVASVLIAVAVLAAACGSSDSDAKFSSAAGGSGGSGASGGSGGSSGGGAKTCRTKDDCSSAQVCHPYAHQCVSPGSKCTGQSDCALGTYCESSLGVCLPGTVGSPCATNENCADGSCSASICACSGLAQEQELIGKPLDIYFIFDRTASMGTDCAYEAGQSPPVDSKACFATYAMSDYLINTTPETDTRLAFQFMSQREDCNGGPYTTPLVGLTALPIAANHQLITAISDETFEGGLGTHIEGALRGLSQWTKDNVTAGREMIGVLMTDGDPNGCEQSIQSLRGIIADHLAATGIRTFIIGMQGATDSNLEELATAGGAEPHDDWCGSVQAPCHYWNVGDGSGNAIASALQAIVKQAAPLPCDFPTTQLSAPAGETLDFNKVNVQLTDPKGAVTTIGQVSNETACPADQLAWYYDNPTAPKAIHLCKNACNTVTGAEAGSRVTVVVGCQQTVVTK